MDSASIPKKFLIAKLYLEQDDPGMEFEMSEWFDKSQKSAPQTTIVLVKLTNGEIFRAVDLGKSCWCTWNEGIFWSGKDIEKWAFIRKINGEDRKNVREWKKVYATTRMSN